MNGPRRDESHHSKQQASNETQAILVPRPEMAKVLKTIALKIMALNGDDLNGGIATIHGLRAAGDKRCV